jgi:multicomponent Na+:H+ antiporter subunit G
MTLIEWVSLVLVLAGGVFMIVGAIGLLRFPDFFCRLHAASVIESMGPLLVLLALILQAGFSQMSAKLLLILLFLWFTSPTASHTLAKTAWRAGVRPWQQDKKDAP